MNPDLWLPVAALAAGWVDAVVGGGGLIQLPALLIGLPGASPAQILATNKLASICGTTTSSITYARRIRPSLRTVLPLAGAAFAGSAAGAACASLLPAGVFRPLVLVLLVAAGLYTWRRPDLGAVTALRHSGHRHTLAAAGVGVGLGFYDGIFGPGTGAFLVLALVAVLGYAFLEASGTAKIANVATNLGALVVFVPQGAPLWRTGLLMGAANVLGGYLGARTAVARGSRFVRGVLLVVVAALVVRLGWDVLVRR
ncbi:TSUP family transporter [Kineosporia sp. R_H_3]|uniref:sulfite exporter TauE/SafE family protein n=1 Tax=Kineosporia sp. R_H_3 TaxID=1961848 RepID=UPI000B4B2486|nr:TSUP family transporter [Kineosporia sp. R_H_3]